MLRAALDAGAPLEAVFYADDGSAHAHIAELLDRASAAGIRAYRLGPGVLERISDTVTPQRVLGLVGFIDVSLDAVTECSPLVLCVDVRDPGNLGAIIRSAHGAGAAGVICVEGTADCYNPKVVRSSAGALFHVPIVLARDTDAVLRELKDAGFRLIATVASDGEDYASFDWSGRVGIVFGNEANGLPPTLSSFLGQSVSIPMAKGAESLNVAMAASVLLFEVARRRRVAGTDSP